MVGVWGTQRSRKQESNLATFPWNSLNGVSSSLTGAELELERLRKQEYHNVLIQSYWRLEGTVDVETAKGEPLHMDLQLMDI